MQNIADILERIPSCTAAVIGDFTLDFYISIHPDPGEISVETGLPVLPVSEYRTLPGGAGNVAINLKDVGVKRVRTFGTVGSDMFGKELLHKLVSQDIDTTGIVVQKEHWDTHVYTKVIENGVEGNRMDFGNFNVLSRNSADEIITQVEKVIDETDIVIINQQLISGIHTSYLRDLLVRLIKWHPETLFITDSRNFPEVYEQTYRKINTEEAASVLLRKGIKIPQTPDRDRETAMQLHTIWKQPVFLTCGERGITVCDSSGCYGVPGIHLPTELDTVGAGDTSLAVISAVLGAGFSSLEAATVGNLAASVTVQKLHTTGTATKKEILALEKEASYIYHPDLSVNRALAAYWKKTEIEIILKPEVPLNYKYILFDHDGTISTLRQGWEQVMEPMMIESITGDTSVDSDLYNKILRAVRDFIDKTTGIQTLIQMKGLIKLIDQFNLVPKQRIRNEFEYKEIYNKKLMDVVGKRTEKFRKGELNLQDVTIKNAFKFLEALYKRGATLFLASGTDAEDVIQEAALLGYNHFFSGGIYGAGMDITKEPKKVVIDTILEKIGKKNAARILTLGDGPVEIAETKKAGGIAIGIASDEKKRYGLNPAKRTRLIRAGADLIIPDYSQMEDLFNFLEKK